MKEALRSEPFADPVQLAVIALVWPPYAAILACVILEADGCMVRGCR